MSVKFGRFLEDSNFKSFYTQRWSQRVFIPSSSPVSARLCHPIVRQSQFRRAQGWVTCNTRFTPDSPHV